MTNQKMFRLTKTQLALITAPVSDVFGRATKTKAVKTLVVLGIYRDTGDQNPFFTLTDKGRLIREALFDLRDLGVI